MRMIGTLAIRRLNALAVAAFLLTTPLLAMALPEDPELTIELDLVFNGRTSSRSYVDDSEWPMSLNEPGNDGGTSSPVPPNNDTIWDVDIGDLIGSSPIVVNNTVYIVTSGGDVHTLNASTGEGIWYKPIGNSSSSTPAVWGDYLLVGNGDNEMVAINMSTGSQVWRVDVGGPVNSAVIIVDGVAYFGSENSKVWAYNVTDGKHLWNKTVSGPVTTVPAYSDDALVVSSLNDIQAFNATDGTPLWTNSTPGTMISGPQARGQSATPFSWLTYVTSDDSRIYAYNISDGFERWNKSISFKDLQTPTGDGDLIFVAGQYEVMCFNYSDGTWYWNYTVSDNISTPVIIGGSDLIVGTDTGIDAANYDSTSGGPQTWAFAINDPNGIALAYGRAFVTMTDGRVLAYGHRPVAVIDSVLPFPVPMGDPLTLTGHGTEAASFTNYRWYSDIDGQITEGAARSTTTISDLSMGTHMISFMVQDDNWTWSEPHTIPATVENPVDWPMFKQNPHHTASTDNLVPSTNGIKWIVDLTGPTENQDIQSSPIIVGDMAFVGTRDFFIHALNLTSGQTVWAFKSGGSVDSTPAYVDGYLYFGSGDARLYCMDADPSDDLNDEGVIDPDNSVDLVWSFDANGPIWSSPAIVNKVAYFTTSPAVDSNNPNPGRLYAISTAPGVASREIWHFTLPNNAPSFSSPVVYEDLVIFGANDNRVYAVNRTTGIEVWNVTTGDSIRSSPAIANGMIYIGSNDNKLYSIHASNGSVAWSKPTGGSIQSSPTVSNGVVYVGSMDGNLYAFDSPDGSQLWTFAAGDGILSSPAVASGFVMFGSFDGDLYVVNTTSHNLFWKRSVTSVAQSSPAIARDTILIGASAGFIYALGKAPDLSIDQADVKFSISTPQVRTPVTIKAMITNEGTIAGNGTVTFFDGQDRVGTQQSVDIDPGESANVSVVWQPSTAGNHLISINITNIRPHDSDPVNNQALKTIKVLEQTEGWRMFQKDEQHTGVLDVAAPNNNEVLWSYDFAGTISSSPVVADSLVVIGTSEGVHSLVEKPPDETGMIFKETPLQDVKSTPAFVSGVVYASSATVGNLYAIDAYDGNIIWQQYIAAGPSSPIVVNDTVFVGNTDGELFAINAINGSVLWNTPIGGVVISSPAVFGDHVVVGNVDGVESKVVALEVGTGKVRWTFPTGHDVRSSPAIDDKGYVYIADTNGTIYKLEVDKNNEDDGIPNSGDYDLIWQYNYTQPIHSTPAISGNNIYFTAGNTTLISLSTTDGGENWPPVEYARDENKVIASSPAVSENKIFVGGDKIYCLDTTQGSEIWNYSTGDTVRSSPAITLGKVFFATEMGTIYAFGSINLKPPMAVITSPLAGEQFRIGEEITFDASGSTDDGVIPDYFWDFGDGTQAAEEISTHSFDNIGDYTITLTVKDNEIPPFSANASVTIHIIPNAAPTLSLASVTPTVGNTSTLFEFKVTYSDMDNDPPNFVMASLAAREYMFKKLDGNSDDYMNGVIYYCSTKLPSGNHTYSFKASDGVLEARLDGEGLKVWQVATFIKDEIIVTMEFVGQGEVIIEAPTLPPDPPQSKLLEERTMVKKDLVRLQTEDILEWKWMWLGINGTGRDLTKDVDPGSLKLFHHNGTSWVMLDTTQEAGTDLIWTNITLKQVPPTLGIFGLFGEPMVENLPPEKDISVEVDPSNPFVNEDVRFTVNAVDPEDDTLWYRFDWDDGSGVTDWDTSNSATHKFTKGKKYEVRIYVTDENMASKIGGESDRSVEKVVNLSVRQEGSSDALIALAVIIFIVLAVAFLVPIKGSKDDLEDEKVRRKPRDEDEKIPEDEDDEKIDDSEE